MSLANIKVDLVSWWDMEEADLETRIDSHGPNDLIAGVSTPNAPGIIGNAIRFTEIVSYNVRKPDPVNMAPGVNDFSVTYWLKLTRLDLTGYTLTRYFTVGNQRGWSFGYASSGVYIQISPDGSQFLNTRGTLHTWVINEWTNVTVSRTGITYAVHVNGVKEILTIPGTESIFDTTAELRSGMIQGGTTENQRCPGDVDSVGYWSRSLTDAEAVSLYNNGLGVNYAQLPEPGGGVLVTARGFANMDRNFINMRG